MANTITQETKNEDKREKKRGGFLARLIGGGGSGGTFGVGSFGSFGGAGGNFGGLFGSGLLATKAGLLAAILAGSTVAGGLGFIGYRLLGSGDHSGSGEVQLFATKPKAAASPEVPPVPEDGSSESLKFFAQANRDPGTPEAPQAASAEAAPQDATAAGAAASDAAEGTGPSNVAAAGGDGVSKGLLKNGKFGALTNWGTEGAGKGVAGGGPAAKPGAAGSDLAAATAAHSGLLSAMRKGLSSSGGARSLLGRKFGGRGALGQAFGAMRDNRSATSSAAGGVTYDGSAPSGGNAGANGSAIGAPGDATAPAQATSVANPAAVNQSLAPPPTPSATPRAPWQNAIKTAQMLIGLAVALMLVAKLAHKTAYGHIIAMVIAAVVAGIGAMVIALGGQIANGQYGQKLQGGVLAAAGVGLMIAAAAIALGGKGANNDGLGADATAADSTSGAAGGASGAGGASDSGSMLSGINPFVLIGGGIGLIGLCGSMMVPPKQYPSSTFQNGNPPDTHFFGSRTTPSETASKKMVA